MNNILDNEKSRRKKSESKKMDAEPTTGGGVTENGSLARPINSASDKIIPDSDLDVNERYSIEANSPFSCGSVTISASLILA